MFGKLLPKNIKKQISLWQEKKKMKELRSMREQQVQKVQQKEVVKVAFLVVNDSIWKYDYLYQLLAQDEQYEPVIFACPFLTFGEDIRKKELERVTQHFTEKGYKIVNTLQENGTYLDVKQFFQPDLVFFCTPWKHSLPQYLIENFDDTLTAYVPYGFKNSNLFDFHFNRPLMNYVWKFFVETEIHKKLSGIHSLSKGDNVVVSGFPGLDVFLDENYSPKDPWKPQNTVKKKIIWGPHHTIPGTDSSLDYSTFLEYYELILELAKKYENELQFALKPHPNLRGKLNDIWGVEKTDAYFETWKNLPNGQLEEGDYTDLFATSDAMIHDSGSFVIEYLYTEKPVIFLIGSEKVKEQFNEIGKKALQHLDLGYNSQDIVTFIENVLVGKDEKAEERHQFFDELVRPPHGLTASENIYNYLNTQFKRNER